MNYQPEYLYDLEQGNPEWDDTRLGRLTGTFAHHLTVQGRKDPDGLGAGLVSLLTEKCAEYIVGNESPDLSSQYWINRGTELEPEARNHFSGATFNTVIECGFITYGPHGGYSPDGLVGSDALIEIKGPAAKKVIALHEGEPIDPKHYAQMMWGLAVTGRKRCHYYVYHDKVKPFYQVIERDENLISQMLDRFHKWEARLVQLIEKYQTNE